MLCPLSPSHANLDAQMTEIFNNRSSWDFNTMAFKWNEYLLKVGYCDWNKEPIGIFMKANADRFLKGMPIAFVFFINFILTLYHLFWLFWSDRYKVFSSQKSTVAHLKRVAMLYLSIVSFDSVRQSPFADSIEPYALNPFIFLRQLQAAAHAPKVQRDSHCLNKQGYLAPN